MACLRRASCALTGTARGWATVYWYVTQWNAEGITDRIHDALRDAVRDRDGRDPMASAGIWGCPERHGRRHRREGLARR